MQTMHDKRGAMREICSWDGRPGEEDKRPSSEEPNRYTAIPATADLFNDVKRNYSPELNAAFRRINERVPKDFWAATLDVNGPEDLLIIPVIDTTN